MLCLDFCQFCLSQQILCLYYGYYHIFGESFPRLFPNASWVERRHEEGKCSDEIYIRKRVETIAVYRLPLLEELFVSRQFLSKISDIYNLVPVSPSNSLITVLSCNKYSTASLAAFKTQYSSLINFHLT